MEFNPPYLDQQRLFSSNKVFAATPITKFYSGKSVFITGSTGFLGTLLLGKLLTTCPIKRAYVLIKPKRGRSLSERYADLLKSTVFDEVRKNNSSAMNNIVPILGDITDAKLGISDENVALLNREIQVVFHSAASINLGAGLKASITVNTKGTAELVELCKGMQQLQALVYVSTAYSNCNRNFIDERVYETNTSLDAVYDIADKFDKDQYKMNKQNLIEGRPNTYTYSKTLAEKIIDGGIPGIPTVIVRPSIIVSPIKTPLPGWAVSWNGVNKLAAAVSEGTLRCWHGKYGSPLDLVPGDQVANLLLASAWDADKRQLKKVKVYNCCSGLQSPLTSGHFLCSSARIARKYSDKIICTSMLIMTSNRLFYKFMWILLQVIPAYLIDLLAWLWGKHGRMRNINQRLIDDLGVLEYFGFNSYTFIDHNVRQLLREMDPEDKILFDFDFSALDWENYLSIYFRGLKKYLTWK